MAFEPVRHIAAIMRGFKRPWFVAGGWALDLFLGRETREHEDIEIAILRRDQEALCRFFSGGEMEKIVPGAGDSKRQLWRGEWLPPPIHEIHVRRVLWMFVGSWIQVTPDGHLQELEVLLDETWAD